jgi:hypothetical protein
MKNIRITYNQIELLDTIHSFRYLPLKVLIKIAKKHGFYSDRFTLGRTILKLENRGYIKSFYYGNNWKVLYITKLGGELLTQAKGILAKDLSIPNQSGKLQFATLEHTVSIAELYEHLVDQIPNYPNLRLADWQGDQKCFYQYIIRVYDSGRNQKRNLSPDSYIKLIKNDEIIQFFLEYDTGQMDRDQLARKFMRYFEYFIYGDWKNSFQSFPSILFITERSENEILKLVVQEGFNLEQALENRNQFTDSDNVIYKGIGYSDNLKSYTFAEITSFLKTQIIFIKKKDIWAKQFLEKL